LAIGVVAVLYGLLVGGGATSWRKDGTLVLVKESGARMLYLNGALHPVLNEASAKLLAGDQLQVEVVDAKSLAGTTIGATIGIAGAPESLPPPTALSTTAWSTCLGKRPGPGGVSTSTVSLRVAAPTTGQPLTEGQAVVTTGPDRATYLLWNGRHWRIDKAHGALAALGYDALAPVATPASILNILPAGMDLAPPTVAGRGEAGPTFAGGQQTRIGQLFTGPSGKNYLLRRDGLVPLTDTVLALLRGDPATQRDAYGGAQVTVSPVGPDDLARLPSTPAAAADLTGNGLLPTTPPVGIPVAGDKALCIRVTPRASGPLWSVELADTGALDGSPPGIDPGVTPSCGPANLVAVQAGTGAVVRALSAAGGVDTVQYLVTDIGVKYPMSADGAKQLGYVGSAEVRLPAALLALLPTGPVLDPSDVGAAAVPSGTAPPGRRSCL
jgi:type VII secretion protein EccB